MLSPRPFLSRLFVVCLTGLLSFSSATAENPHGRATAGLQVFYDFDGSGPRIEDRSGTGRPLHLRIGKMDAVKRSGGAIITTSQANIISEEPADRLVEAVQRSGELTVEAWLKPADDKQSGPARIVTLSKDTGSRNFTLGQDGPKFDVRMRTNQTDGNGLPSLSSRGGSVNPNELTHVIYTRRGNGEARLFLNGQPAGQMRKPGRTANWDKSFRLGLAGEISGERTWLGELHLVAIYSTALNADQVAANFRAGPEARPDGKLDEAQQLVIKQRQEAEFFETRIAPILSQHCLECHDAAAREGGLDLSRKEFAFAGGDSGKAIVPGDLEHSEMWQQIDDDTMPLDRDPLKPEEKELVRKWISDGAPWTVDYVDPAIYRSIREGGNWIQRLTIDEYIQSVRTAVDVDIADEARKRLPQDKRADGFRNTAYNLNVDLQHVEAYAALAETIVSRMEPAKFARQFTSKTELTDDNLRGLISDMGKRVLRGPLNEDEIALYRGISTTVASAGGDFNEAVGYVLEAMLQSPRFLYRIENQVGDGQWWPVDNYEMANRMSYILWGAPPDKTLLAAAESGELNREADIRKQIDRMLEDPLAVERSKQFVIGWLNLDRLQNMNPNREQFPNWLPSLAEDMRRETIDYFLDVVWKQKRPLSDLLHAQFTYATPALAKHYRIEPQGDGFQKYDLSNVPSRGGILTQGSVLTVGGDNASMVTRGLFVLNDLLFSEVGDPPPGLDTTPVPTSPGRTHRAIAMERIESEACGGCHARFEPLAFGLEKFDGLGSFLDRDEHGNELREDGEILFPGQSEPVAYQTSHELMALLAGSDRVSECLSRKLIQFSLSRPLEAGDARQVRQIHQAAQEAGGRYGDILTELILSDLVRKTRTEPRP